MPLSWRWLYNLQTQTFLSEVEWRKENHKLKCVSLGEVFAGKDKNGEVGGWSSAYRDYWGRGVWAVNEGRDSVEGKRDFCARENEISIESEMAGNVPF